LSDRYDKGKGWRFLCYRLASQQKHIGVLGDLENLYNPSFNYGEFATIRNQSGLNSFKISVKEFISRTNAFSLEAKASRYGGTSQSLGQIDFSRKRPKINSLDCYID
jgi:hypothetical protein